MTWIKICGITNLEDALVAVEAGADALGFVFYEKSPRCVSVETAREIVAKLPENIEKVGVFVGDSGPDCMKAVHQVGLTGLQQYSPSEPSEPRGSRKETGLAFAENLTFRSLPGLPFGRILAVLPVGSILESEAEIEGLARIFERLRDDVAERSTLEGMLGTLVLDSGAGHAPGGTGKTFDWAKVRPIAEGTKRGGVRLVVAGGLTPQNVSEAISILKPWGVDVSSGVEARPGKKDPEKVRAFVRTVRGMDRKGG